MRKGSWEFMMAEMGYGKVESSASLLEKEGFDIGNDLHASGDAHPQKIPWESAFLECGATEK
jgi:hypothetical protein